MSVSVNPGDFWCNLLENSEEHQIYQDLLQERYTDDSDVAPESEVEIGYICVAKFCDDEQYYRVRVVTEKNDCGKLEVLLFDYGNITSVKVSELKKIRAEDLVLPQQGIHCKVAGIAPDSEDDIWDEKSYSRFEELTSTKDLFIVPQKLDHQTYVVDLCENENSIGELLVQGGYAKKVEVTGGESTTEDDTEESFVDAVDEDEAGPFKRPKICADSEYDVQVIDVTSPYKFHVQLIESIELLETVTERIKNYILDNPDDMSTEDIQPCAPCLALLEEDETWCRARINQVDDEEIMVFYVDYGHEDLVHKDNLKKIPSDLLDIPALAIPCKLSDIKPVDQQQEWPDDALAFFKEYCDNHSVISVYVEKVTGNCVSLGTMTAIDSEEKENVSRQLVDLAFADAIEGSALEIEMQNEETDLGDENGFADISCNATALSLSEFDSTADTSHICSACDTTTENLEGSSVLDTTSESFTYVCHKCTHGTSTDSNKELISVSENEETSEETETANDTGDSSVMENSSLDRTGEQSGLLETAEESINVGNECEHEAEEEDEEWHDAGTDKSDYTVEESDNSVVIQDTDNKSDNVTKEDLDTDEVKADKGNNQTTDVPENVVDNESGNIAQESENIEKDDNKLTDTKEEESEVTVSGKKGIVESNVQEETESRNDGVDSEEVKKDEDIASDHKQEEISQQTADHEESDNVEGSSEKTESVEAGKVEKDDPANEESRVDLQSAEKLDSAGVESISENKNIKSDIGAKSTDSFQQGEGTEEKEHVDSSKENEVEKDTTQNKSGVCDEKSNENATEIDKSEDEEKTEENKQSESKENSSDKKDDDEENKQSESKENSSDKKDDDDDDDKGDKSTDSPKKAVDLD
ncbi:hypothetical protein KUTeg_017109 [Tegillarca granosa]|uniref:Tudor domain-containing protein n=1 Tax=Tegillarca granosa TaxID=220873 RepID=A0ABQ9EMY2_TEGGR|nr:hypothetical protein KUTeg_017109 [Tegillarca granosa]